MTFLNRQNVLKRWKVLWSDQFNYVLLFFIELQSCMSRYTGFEYNTTIILSIYWLFFFREDCQWCNFVFINKYFPWKFKCFKNTSHKFLFICIQLWNKFGQIYIYYMKQLRKLTCCFLTIFFKFMFFKDVINWYQIMNVCWYFREYSKKKSVQVIEIQLRYQRQNRDKFDPPNSLQWIIA